MVSVGAYNDVIGKLFGPDWISGMQGGRFVMLWLMCIHACYSVWILPTQSTSLTYTYSLLRFLISEHCVDCTHLCRHPDPAQRHTFKDVANKLSSNPRDLLKWSVKDKVIHLLVTRLGADLKIGYKLYPDLQSSYQSLNQWSLFFLSLCQSYCLSVIIIIILWLCNVAGDFKSVWIKYLHITLLLET